MLCVLLPVCFFCILKLKAVNPSLSCGQMSFGRLGIHWCQHIRSKGSNSMLSYFVSLFQQFTVLCIPYLCFRCLMNLLIIKNKFRCYAIHVLDQQIPNLLHANVLLTRITLKSIPPLCALTNILLFLIYIFKLLLSISG